MTNIYIPKLPVWGKGMFLLNPLKKGHRNKLTKTDYKYTKEHGNLLMCKREKSTQRDSETQLSVSYNTGLRMSPVTTNLGELHGFAKQTLTQDKVHRTQQTMAYG